VQVLGPPDLTQTNAIRKQRVRDSDPFWHLVSGVVPTGGDSAPRGKRSDAARGASRSKPGGSAIGCSA
jgi:hypothetical protein